MDVVISGRVTAILPIQQGVSQKSGQPWQSMEFVLCHEEGQYPRSVCVRIFGEDKIKQANIQMGEYITCHINVDARQASGGRWFNSLDVWKVDRQAAAQAQPAGQPQYQQAPQPQYQQSAQQYQGQPAPFPPQQPAQQQNPFPPAQGQPQDGQLPF